MVARTVGTFGYNKIQTWLGRIHTHSLECTYALLCGRNPLLKQVYRDTLQPSWCSCPPLPPVSCGGGIRDSMPWDDGWVGYFV